MNNKPNNQADSVTDYLAPVGFITAQTGDGAQSLPVFELPEEGSPDWERLKHASEWRLAQLSAKYGADAGPFIKGIHF